MPGLLKLKEDEITELKSSFGDGAIEALAAFANTKGGSIYIGINDKGNPVKGFTIGKETLQKWINEVKLKTQPGIIPDAAIATIDGIKVGVLSVKEFPVKLVSFKGRYYKRSNAAWLLFGKGNIGYNVHMGRFKTPTHIIDDKMLNGALFQTVEEIMQYMVAQMKVAFEIKGMPTQRIEIFEYPLPALREIALNCLIHRDYRSPIDAQIKLFDNYVSFFNPGKLLGELTLEDLKRDNYRAYARNKLIAEAFYLTGDIEKYGSGFLRIRKEISAYPTMHLTVAEIPNGLDVSLSYTQQKTGTNIASVSESVSENVSEKLSINQQKILNAIKSNNKITYTGLKTYRHGANQCSQKH